MMTAVGRGRYLGRVMGEGISEDLLCKDLVEGSVSGNQSRQGKSKCRGPQAGHEEQQGVKRPRIHPDLALPYYLVIDQSYLMASVSPSVQGKVGPD